MADSSNFKRDAQFHNNDPFAELTRIMGHDPRAAQPEPSLETSDDPFEIDLERELMGEFDADLESGRTAASAPVAEPEVDELQVAIGELTDGYQIEDPADWALEDDIDVEMNTAFAGDLDLDAQPDASLSSSVDEEEDEAEWVRDGVEAAADAPLMESLPFASEPQDISAPDAGRWHDDYRAAEAEQGYQAAGSGYEEGDELDETPLDLDVMDEAALVRPQEPFMADVDMDFGDLTLDMDAPSSQPSGAAAPLPILADEWDLRGPVHDEAEVDDDMPSVAEVPAQAVASDEMTLEDELEMLLASDDQPAAAARSDAPASHPIFGRANLAGAAAMTSGIARAPAWTQDDEHIAPSDMSDGDGYAVAEELPEQGIEDELSLDHEQFEPEHAEYQAPEAVEPAPDPFADLTTLASPVAQSPARAPAWETPDLDIQDVPDGQIALSDDLDLPEVPQDEQADDVARFDDLDAEFAELFGAPEGALAGDAAPTRPAAAAASQPDIDDDDYFRDVIGGAAGGLAFGGASAAGATSSAYRPNASGMADANEPGYDPDLDREISLAHGAMAAPQRFRRPSGMVIAAAAGGLALLGIIGAFAFGGGGADDAPALVRAEVEPLKVRPENPGGTQVPNQDSQAYERAAGGVGATVPAQEELVTTTEEPVNVAERVAPEPAAPGIELSNEAGADDAAKAEDRVLPNEDAAGADTNADIVAVAPRRVRTMIVRPDGTLVPREDPPGAAEPTQAPLVAAAEPSPMLPAPGLTPPAQPAAPQASATQPSASQPILPAPTPAPQQRPEPAVQQQVAAAPAAARPEPAAPAPATDGEWSMQIASQPTAEGAQASYQDLARRYSNLLSGRGVNIVRADIAGRGTYYRVRIPATTRNDAIALCERYKGAGGSCFVSK